MHLWEVGFNSNRLNNNPMMPPFSRSVELADTGRLLYSRSSAFFITRYFLISFMNQLHYCIMRSCVDATEASFMHFSWFHK